MFRRVALLRKVLSGRGAGEGQEKLKGGTCAYAGGVCSAATSLNLLCIVEGCLVYTRLHMCLVHLCKASSSGTSHTQTMLFAYIYIYIYIERNDEGNTWKWRKKILENFTILPNFS